MFMIDLAYEIGKQRLNWPDKLEGKLMRHFHMYFDNL